MPLGHTVRQYSCTGKKQIRVIFLALLVSRRLFLSVNLMFLIVGHTHQDINNGVTGSRGCWVQWQQLSISAAAEQCLDLALNLAVMGSQGHRVGQGVAIMGSWGGSMSSLVWVQQTLFLGEQSLQGRTTFQMTGITG